MENLKMHTPDLAEENYRKLAELFPNAVTETITGYDEDGKAIIERAIDADVLRQEIAAQVVEGSQERYQFTWPDKKRSVPLRRLFGWFGRNLLAGMVRPEASTRRTSISRETTSMR